jgi:hypothetical protein
MTNKNKTMNQEVYQDYEPDYKANSLDYLNDWVFHFNAHTEQWAAIPRETYNEYWNDYKKAGVLRSKHLNTLLDLLHKSKGNTDIIEDITRGEIK